MFGLSTINRQQDSAFLFLNVLSSLSSVLITITTNMRPLIPRFFPREPLLRLVVVGRADDGFWTGARRFSQFKCCLVS